MPGKISVTERPISSSLRLRACSAYMSLAYRKTNSWLKIANPSWRWSMVFSRTTPSGELESGIRWRVYQDSEVTSREVKIPWVHSKAMRTRLRQEKNLNRYTVRHSHQANLPCRK